MCSPLTRRTNGTPPFEAVEKDGRLYGRGISDDKAPMLIALDTLAAFIAVEGKLPVNIKLLIEGRRKPAPPPCPPYWNTTVIC
ncbi:M20/M25/M40 family metallo-hydrolase [Sulfitobacter pacificus]|uniref:M20/M25/M40 family metallo-hydrolase n=1 Tax=Sulfitobacter pacificus TaxID=1499314 RepID=UPI00361D7916